MWRKIRVCIRNRANALSVGEKTALFCEEFKKLLQNLLQFDKQCDIILMFVVRDTTLDVKEHQNI